MIRIEEEILLKLQETSPHGYKFSYMSHYDEGTLSSSLLQHVRFGHLNYQGLFLLKKMALLVCQQFLGNLRNVMLVNLESTTNNLFMILNLECI